MLTREEIVQLAHANGFEDVGFTTAAPFDTHRAFLENREAEYGWVIQKGLPLLEGIDPKKILTGARTIIVLMEVYFRHAYRRVMEGHFGRCYLDDDRITKDGLARRIKSFRTALGDHGIQSKCPFHLPHRVAAARAGMGTFGKNCLFYSNKVARQSSWVLPITIVIDKAYEPDEPSIEMGCPDWCRNACIAACPTRALKGNGTIDPRRCISYLTYFGDGLTPEELREPMGIMVYGCDRCQEVCPRNTAWLAKEKTPNPRTAAKAPAFDLVRLLHMNEAYFNAKIWPHMFYMGPEAIWRWKMNVARAMGNSGDQTYVPELVAALDPKADPRVSAMIVWALSRLGGQMAEEVLIAHRNQGTGLVQEEIARLLASGTFQKELAKSGE
jgi:epoxyqueuosine reductase